MKLVLMFIATAVITWAAFSVLMPLPETLRQPVEPQHNYIENPQEVTKADLWITH